uniref:Glutathione peroxidase n=1 Tax=Globisporangium ultimum (strain ATCC 200006 / CBS 805.95 / DAOM BR144) TaxID=431595 RepID=K3X328_GLOUD
MMKLPSGSGCDSGDEHAHQPNGNFHHQNQQQYLQNIPVAVPVPSSSMPSLNRQRSAGTPNTPPNASLQQQRRKTVHQFSFRSLTGGEYIRLADYAGKVILLVNVASHCNSTTKAYTQMNELAEKYPDLVIIGCPCNQFGHQENLNGEEIYTSLKHIRPGKGFEPKFKLTEKMEVNGANAHAVFNFLKLSLPYPADRTLMDEMSSPSGVFSHPMRLIWMPVSRADLSWNFEKFLIGPDGVPFKRFSPKLDFKSISDDIELLMKMETPSNTTNTRGAEKQL